MDMGKIDDWLSGIPSKYTRKTYKAGIKKFEEFYGKPIESMLNLSDEECGHTIEKFYSWLKEKGHGQNTCRNLINSPLQFLKYFGKNPKYRKALGMYKTVLTTRDHRTSISEIQEMAKVADLREQALLEVYLLGLRIGDVSALEWKTFDVNGEAPIPILINTNKENVVARSFITQEFKAILDKYLNTIDKNNKYLFQSARKGHLTTRQIDNILKGLVKRAGVVNHGLFRWHTGRKLFLRSCAELGISSWSAKLMCGKSIPASDDTYVHDAELKNDFTKLSNTLRLFPKTTAESTDLKKSIDLIFQVLRSLVEDKLKEEGFKADSAIPLKSKTQWQKLYKQLTQE